MIERARPAAETWIARDRAVHESLRPFDGFRQRHAFGEISGDGGRVCTSGPVGVRCGNAGRAESVDAPIVEKEVDRVARKMATFDEDRLCAEAGKCAGRTLHRGGRIDGEATERFGLGEIGHEERGAGHQVSEEDWGGTSGREVGAVLGEQDGIDNQGEVPTGRGSAECFDQFQAAQGAGLGAGGGHVVEEGIDLREHEFRSEAFDTGERVGVLDGEEAHNRFTVDAELVKGFEIRLNTGPAGGVRTGDGESNWCGHSASGNWRGT